MFWGKSPGEGNYQDDLCPGANYPGEHILVGNCPRGGGGGGNYPEVYAQGLNVRSEYPEDKSPDNGFM